MSPISTEEVDERRYGGVNGNEITLIEKRTGENNKVIEFTLRNESLIGIKRNLLFLFLAILLGYLINNTTLITVAFVTFALYCQRVASSVNFDALLVVESVGVQISSKKVFLVFNSSQFLPWTTVEDVFINEVITGRVKTFEGMPGIHVRGIGKSDKTRELQTLSTLNVPGSYWLSHKQNIYKFTFKYQETNRDNVNFLYKDELLKVIRHIIKCQPNQGQLNTVHLSITYKHTFWTRQDKMFAMLKFQNREGSTAFSQAFVLSISLRNSRESDEQFTSKMTQADSNTCSEPDAGLQPFTNTPHCDSKISSNGNASPEIEDNENLSRVHKFQNFQNSLTNANPVTTTTTITTTTIATTTATKTGTIDSSIDIENVEDLNFDEPKSFKGAMPKRRSKSRMQRRDNRLSLPSDLKKYDESRNAVNGDPDKSPRGFDTGQNLDSCENSDDRISTDLEKGKDEGKIEEVRVESEPTIPRSSDITDQVMEGLMFTIKQGENNIRVVEQMTKMELDEVLENSEKIETKEGEKCLVNSSLLGLENLVTKIEVPNKHLKDIKSTSSIIKIDEKSSPSTLIRNYNEKFRTSFSSLQPRKSTDIPPSCTNQIPPLSSLESNGNNRSFDKLFLSTNEPILFQPPRVNLRIHGDKDVINRFHENVIERKRRNLVLGKINSEINRQATEIKKRKIVKSRDSGTNGRTDDSSYADNDFRDVNNDDNNNNNGSSSGSTSINNNINGTSNIIADEVQIDMWKLLQDIARGVKVMVKRISDTDIKNAIGSQNSPKHQTIAASATDTSTPRRVPTRSTK